MCAELEFCAQCEPSDRIKQFASGDTHLMPAFGDDAQMRTALLLRERKYLQLVSERDQSIRNWPEFRSDIGRAANFKRAKAHCREVLWSAKHRHLRPASFTAMLQAEYGRQSRSLKKRPRNGYVRFKRQMTNKWLAAHFAEAEALTFGSALFALEPAKAALPFVQLPYQPELCQVKLAKAA